MRVLALDTTTREGSVAIVDEDRVIVERVGDPARSHTERLPGEILAALAACDMPIAGVDVFAVAAGPGSFTGIRIGIATIQGLALVGGKPVVPIPVLAALAEAADPRPGSTVGAWMDAHRGEVFSALYRVSNAQRHSIGHLIEIDEPRAGDPRLIWESWRGSGTLPERLIGDGATAFADAVGGAVLVVAPPPLAGVVGRMAAARAHAGHVLLPAGVQPIYVRRPDVEVARERKT